MLDIYAIVADELGLLPMQVNNALALYNEGATLPFIARYRKERTGEMDELQLRALFDRYEYLKELEERKGTILETIEGQGKLTDELRQAIEACIQKTELEDLYLPYKPKRRTRATIAREKGLEPLAQRLAALNVPGVHTVSLEEEAAPFLSEELGVTTAEALQGASDILAEQISEQAAYRAWIRDYLMNEGAFVSRVKGDHPEGTTKYEMYRDFSAPVKSVASHNVLAMRRGEEEGILAYELNFEEETVISYLEAKENHAGAPELRSFISAMIQDAFTRLMKFSLIGEVRYEKKLHADVESIQTFEANLRELLLASPAGMKPSLGIDPGFRTGCKVAAIDTTGKFLDYKAIFPHNSARERERAADDLRGMIKRYGIELIAIGNGTAGRETEEFVRETLVDVSETPVVVIVNESGASVYSASDVAVEEFPDQNITVRGAVSIGRRLQDPLAELVKIDPKSIGVGQYQHDVDQRLLKKKLEETVESCVNYVGVDLNMASKELLGYVAGVTATTARNIVAHRNEHGAFRSRAQLLDVPMFGKKAFEQSAGFLRIRGGDTPLDNTAVHPESYHIVERIAQDVGVEPGQITTVPDKIREIDLKRYITETVGEPTLRDIIGELQKPGRDPRAEFRYAKFAEGVKEIRDLREGMTLEGVVTNVANFGAFVDIGVHQDGLVHISQLADCFVNDPKDVVKVGQVVTVRVLEVNEKLKRISLSMKAQNGTRTGAPPKDNASAASAPATLDDLIHKFNKK